MRLMASMLAMAMLASNQSMAQSAGPGSDTEVSKEVENPVTRRTTLPLRYEADFLDGPYKATKDTFSIDQAVVPFRLGEDWALITRTKLPAIVQPPKKLVDHWAAGLSNEYTTFFLSPDRRSTARVSTGVPGRFSITLRRRTRWARSTNGAQSRRRPS